MISSTALDLPDHRKAAMDAVLRADCFPLAMEAGTATSGTDAIRYSRAMVDEADVYVGIFGHRYGHVPDDPEKNPQGWSVTEHEYRRAVERGLPILGYLMDKEHPITIEDIDRDPAKVAKLEALKAELRKGVCAFFASPQQLQSLVIQSLFEEKEKLGRDAARPLPDRAASIPLPPELYAVPPYTLTNRFIGRKAELSELDSWPVSADTVMVVEAIGGMGKSALTWQWLQERAAVCMPGLAGRIWWSFYERATSMKTFLRHALAYVTRQDPGSLLDLSAYDCGQQLLGELRRRPYLLVLDGFERVLAAYHRIDKAQVPDDRVATDKRECTNPADGDILRQLVACQPSKIIVSTRLMPAALQDRQTHRLIPWVRHWEIVGLNPEDTLQLVREAGIRGDADGIAKLADQFGRHALVLRIVCGMIADYRPKPGDFDAWRADPHAGGGLKLGELPLKQRYTHILEYAFRGLGEKERQLLSRIAVLSDAADYATIVVLNPFVPPPPEKVPEPEGPYPDFDWQRFGLWLNRPRLATGHASIEAERAGYRPAYLAAYELHREAYERYQEALRSYFSSAEHRQAMTNFHSALSDLEDRGLLQWDRHRNTYDLHPVVRGYAFEQLEEHDRTQTYSAIGDHFAALPPDNLDEATELSHVKNSLEVLRAFIGAGRFQEAVEFYSGDLAQSLLFVIGGYNVIVELIGPMIGHDGRGSPILPHIAERSYAMNDVAISLEELGRIAECLSLYRESIRIDAEHRQWSDLAIDLQNLADCDRKLNKLAASERIYEVASGLVSAASLKDLNTALLVDQMTLAITLGNFAAAESLLSYYRRRAPPPAPYYRQGEAEYRYASLRFMQGRLDQTDLDRAEQLVAQGRSIEFLHLIATLRAEWELTLDRPEKALEAIENALAIMRRVGAPAANYMGLRALALARLGRGPEAREALGEVDESPGRSQLRYPLFAAEAWLALDDRKRAREFIRKAYPLAWADGPPYVSWYDLKRCRELMAEIDEPEPQLPPFDPARVEPVPFEVEIRAAIDKLNAERAKKKRGKKTLKGR
jgi:tetratricopeptide (TPR) repeat protein